MAIHFTERGGGCVISELKMFLFEVGFLVAVLQVYPTYAVENQGKIPHYCRLNLKVSLFLPKDGYFC